MLPFPDGFFTSVIYFSIFPHLSKKQKALTEAKRLLVTGGKLIIAHLASREKLNEFHGNLDTIVKDDILPDQKEMFTLLETAQFKNIEFINSETLYFIQAYK